LFAKKFASGLLSLIPGVGPAIGAVVESSGRGVEMSPTQSRGFIRQTMREELELAVQRGHIDI
jgi:hypothetical protein